MVAEKILAAVTPDESGRHAGDAAINMALSRNARLTVLTVAPNYEGNMDLLHVKDARETIIFPHRELLSHIKQKAKNFGIHVTTVLKEGEPVEAIIDLAENQSVDLIVMGSGRKSLVKRALLGSTAARVIGHGAINVLIVPPESKLDFHRILVASDGSIPSRAAEDAALDLGVEYGSVVSAVIAVDFPAEYHLHEYIVEGLWNDAKKTMAAFRDKAERRGLKTDTFVVKGEAFQVIVDEAVKHNAGLIVMGARGRSALTKLLMGRVIERVLALSPVPIWVVH